ncbi:MAG: endonuclease III [Candidatus Aenigmarchaeota archaeon]|nr:endonuclease III [Candidatus Aenigmarchaeota archaeon]MDW8149459.1 endonuclease III [Candidatus Aenigmarchaeota archaeon]
MQIEKVFRLINKMKEVKNAPVFKKINIVDKNPFKIMVFAVLSPRTKDEILIETCNELFKKANSFEDILKIKKKELETILRKVGFYKRKTVLLKKLARAMVKLKKVPRSLEELMKLPGIGRKVGKVILNELFDLNVIPVDTHVHRISNRLGIVHTKNISETEKELEKIIPNNMKKIFNRYLVALGQTICKPKKPLCKICALKNFCKFYRLQ